MVLKGGLFFNALERFKLLAWNPKHKEVLCMFITYDSFMKGAVRNSYMSFSCFL
jgi:hypothetical protein